jgi:hypothetical protein
LGKHRAYLDGRIFGVLLQKKWDVLWVILRFSNNIMSLWCRSNLFPVVYWYLSLLLITVMNTTEVSLMALNLSQLLDKAFVACVSIPGLG